MFFFFFCFFFFVFFIQSTAAQSTYLWSAVRGEWQREGERESIRIVDIRKVTEYRPKKRKEYNQ
jgi:hypothetical protein